jgi:DNA-binding transcriptional regulator YhcF (GntR family)
MDVLSLAQLRLALKTHQKRLRAGDNLPTLKAIADLAGVHRDTLYALIDGDRISIRSQYAINKAIKEVEAQTADQTKTKVMSVDLTATGPKLSFGINKLNIFR